MVIHIKHNRNSVVTKIVEKESTKIDKKELLETAKAMAKVMAKEMAKELIANMPVQKIIEIRGKENTLQPDDIVALDESIIDVTKTKEFTKNFESLGTEKKTEDSGQSKRDKLKKLLKKI